MSAAQTCEKHGEWVDDGTTDDCPECIAEAMASWSKRPPILPRKIPAPMSELQRALALLREGTEILRTGGGVFLSAALCNALLDEVERLNLLMVSGGSGWIIWATPERGDWYIFGRAESDAEVERIKEQALEDQDRTVVVRRPGNPPWEPKVSGSTDEEK
jgi:hypothetical protein